VVLGGWAFSDERGTPVQRYFRPQMGRMSTIWGRMSVILSVGTLCLYGNSYRRNYGLSDPGDYTHLFKVRCVERSLVEVAFPRIQEQPVDEGPPCDVSCCTFTESTHSSTLQISTSCAPETRSRKIYIFSYHNHRDRIQGYLAHKKTRPP